MYGSETVIWKEIDMPRLGLYRRVLRRMGKVPNALKGELCGVTKGLDGRIEEDVLLCSGHGEKRMGNDRIAERVYVEECAGSPPVCRLRNIRINSLNDCLQQKKCV